MMAKRHKNEMYIEWYTRKLGSMDRYARMEPKQLARRVTNLQRDLGATLVYLRRDPTSETGSAMVALLEPHYDAAVRALRG